ncbi:MAG: acetyl-CoA carboxylase biotin carboxyl carrier protein subunit [Acidobacteria bacterium]|nr:MAG: acetyl-CoA carboxylase biotin carboxyl carrier protein subunit [Acidobacteriota bacterium]
MKKFKFTIRGNKYDVTLLKMEDNLAEIEVNSTVYRVEVERKQKSKKTPKLVRQRVVPSGHSAKAKTAKPTAAKGTGHVKAPLPGTILSIGVKEGDTVKSGDKLLVMEAMKMENSINADRRGTVTAVKVNVGDSVLEGDVLVEIGS